MDDLVLAAIRRRIAAKIPDLDRSAPARLQPADPHDVADDERQLGFPLPPLLKRIYSELANGGFGPGYGLIGLTNGIPDDTGKTGPAIYRMFRDGDPEDPRWTWPEGLLPICHWGCAILSCIDCADPNFRMRIFDPNEHRDEDWADAFFEESPSFEEWIGAWASGVDLWTLMYGEEGHITRLLAARKPIS
ncbi:SMI1/KNR4 family protein [Mycobacterium sp. KBS0706]|uniref:SMI1/KNR4 family protein n=1 Tax=Mycobacterium sp. KBS0706 TaxID=2578109 RepID=UPI00110FD0A0|nr:SMI1/KNR4 family protein [Mycobacterium sp. KBS0706]TSD87110.1 SMI1/KNR4 family protein [Mycobacterium sp. KBS0706]